MGIARGKLETVAPKRVVAFGSFGMEQTSRRSGEAVKAYYELPVTAAGPDLIVEADASGVNGNALTFTATNDGTAKAELNMATITTNIDTTVEAATGGVGGNDWSISVIGGAAAGAGLAHEDATNKVLTCIMQLGISDVSDFETLVAASTALAVGSAGTGGTVIAAGDECYSESLAGGTAATWAEVAAGTTELHFTDAVTTVDAAIAALNALSDKDMTARSSNNAAAANVIAAGDAATSALAEGAATSDVLGKGFSVQGLGAGSSEITLDEPRANMVMVLSMLQLNTADNHIVEGSTITPSTKKIVLTVYDNAGAASAPTPHLNNRIHFVVIEVDTGSQ